MIPVATITRNSSHIWVEFYKSLQEHTPDHQLFVFDNKSRQGDIEYLFSTDSISHFIYGGKNLLFTRAANALMRKVMEHDFDQVVLANPDIQFTHNWYKDVEQNEGIMGFLLMSEDYSIEHAGGFGGGEHIGKGEYDITPYKGLREVDWVTFGAVVISRKVIEKIGYLDESLPHFGSDREYCRKARQAGFKVTCSDAQLIHGFGKSTRPYVWEDIPADIWKQMVQERRSAGCYFPDDPKEFRHN